MNGLTIGLAVVIGSIGVGFGAILIGIGVAIAKGLMKLELEEKKEWKRKD